MDFFYIYYFNKQKRGSGCGELDFWELNPRISREGRTMTTGLGYAFIDDARCPS